MSIGLRGTGSDSYTVADLFVPESHTVLREAEPKLRQPGLLYAFSSSNMYSSGFAGVALGIARSTLDAFIVLARDKIPRGAKRTLRDDNVVQSQVAQSEARLRAARAFLLGSLEQIWRDVAQSARLTLDHNTTIRLASTWAIHQAKDVVDTAYHAAGSDGDLREQPVRAPPPRCPHRDPAISRPPGALRDGRPGTARPSGRRHNVHILNDTARQLRWILAFQTQTNAALLANAPRVGATGPSTTFPGILFATTQ